MEILKGDSSRSGYSNSDERWLQPYYSNQAPPRASDLWRPTSLSRMTNEFPEPPEDDSPRDLGTPPDGGTPPEGSTPRKRPPVRYPLPVSSCKLPQRFSTQGRRSKGGRASRGRVSLTSALDDACDATDEGMPTFSFTKEKLPARYSTAGRRSVDGKIRARSCDDKDEVESEDEEGSSPFRTEFERQTTTKGVETVSWPGYPNPGFRHAGRTHSMPPPITERDTPDDIKSDTGDDTDAAPSISTHTSYCAGAPCSPRRTPCSPPSRRNSAGSAAGVALAEARVRYGTTAMTANECVRSGTTGMTANECVRGGRKWLLPRTMHPTPASLPRRHSSWKRLL